MTDLQGFQTKLWATYVILHFTNSRKTGHQALSWSDLPVVHLETLLAGSLIKRKKKQHKITGTTRLCQAWHQCTKERDWAKQIYTMHSSTVEHAKHPYTDTKSNQCLTKKNLNTNVSSTAEGWLSGPREGGAGWDPAGVNPREKHLSDSYCCHKIYSYRLKI